MSSAGLSEQQQPELQADALAPLPQRVASQLRDMIVQDVLPPGSPIRERTLAGQLNVSRTPMREALKILSAERLVELSPHRGAVVAHPSSEDVHDMLTVLANLEALAGELAATRASDEDIAEIKALHYEMLAAYARQDRLAYFKLNQRIHLAIVAASRNETLIETHGQINARLYRVRYQSNLKNTEWHTAIEEHEEILKQLCARAPAGLSDILRRHLGSTWAKVRGTFEVEPESPEQVHVRASPLSK